MRPSSRPDRSGRDGGASACLDGVHLIRYGQFGGTGGLSAHLEALDAALVQRFAMTIHELAAEPVAGAGGGHARLRAERGEIARVGLAGALSRDDGAAAGETEGPSSELARGAMRLLAVAIGRAGPAAGDRLRRLHGALAVLPLLPEVLPLTRRLPLAGGAARRLGDLQHRAGIELDTIVAEAGDAPLAFVSHLPERVDSLLVTREACRRLIPSGFVHHTGATPRAALVFARTRALVRAGGAVSLRGLGDLLGSDAVELGNGVDTDFFDRTKAARGRFRARHPELRPGALLVLVPGKVCERKRQLDVVRACARLRAEQALPEFQVVIVGTAPDRGYRDRLADEVGRSGHVDDVTMVGHLGREELREAYRDADLGVLASSLEGRPRVLLEMGAMGVPVVATDAGGSRDTVLPGRSGLVVPVGDWQRLAGAIGELLADPQRRLRLGEAGAAFVREHHRLDLLVDRHVRFYLSLLASRRGPERPRTG